MTDATDERINAQETASAEADINGGDTPETLAIGGVEDDNALHIDTNSNPLNVDGQSPQAPAPQNPAETPVTPDNEAYLEDGMSDNEKGRKKRDSKFTPVKEQDIIDFMYQAYFMGLLNWTLESSVKGADKLLDALCGNYENVPQRHAKATSSSSRSSGGSTPTPPPTTPTPPPTTPTPPPTTPTPPPTTPTPPGGSQQNLGADGVPYLDQINAAERQSAQYFLNVTEKMLQNPEAIKKTVECIAQNIGKEAKNWQPIYEIDSSGNKKMIFNPQESGRLIDYLNAAHNKNPQGFKQNLDKLQQNPHLLSADSVKNCIKIGALMATLEYASAHPGVQLEGNTAALDKIGKNTFANMMEIMTTAQQIQRKNENEYRLLQGGVAKDKLDKIIQNKSQTELTSYFKGIGERAKHLKELLPQHYEEKDAGKKQILAQQIAESAKDFRLFAGQYTNPNETYGPKSGILPKTVETGGKETLFEAAVNFSAAEKRNQEIFNRYVQTSGVQELTDRMTQLQQRNSNLQARKLAMGLVNSGNNNSGVFNFMSLNKGKSK